jgi:hypothetical protein
VAADIEQSPEARTRLVRGWYQAYLGRSPVGGEEKGWVAALAAGATEEQVLTGILSSDEFFFGASLAVPSGSPGGRYVQALYQHLFHRTAGPAELAWWEAVLAAGGRPAVAGALLASGEYRAGVITTYYATLLKRKSTSPAEVGFWAASGLDLLTIQLQFEDSDEFFWQG